MKKNTVVILFILALVIIGGVVYATQSGNPVEVLENESEKSTSLVESDPMAEKSTQMDKSETDVPQEEDKMIKSGSYEAYSPEKLARAETGEVVLFFHASWCPSCRGLNADIEKNLSVIPQGVSILKTDYDRESELKKKYGITYQHTMVQVDKDGNLIKKWSGSPSLNSLLSQIK